jgi:STE24 endopeptidase
LEPVILITWNLYAWLTLAIVVGLYLLDLVSDLLNLSALRHAQPAELAGLYDDQKYARSQSYTRANTRLGMIESAVSLIIFLGFWLVGGFHYLDQWVRNWTSGELVAGLAYLFLLGMASYLIRLPFSVIDTFWIEERFGFNRTQVSTFILDQLKVMALGITIGGPLLAAILSFFMRFPQHGWWIVWATLTIFSLGMSYLAPRWILPLFNRYQPLEEGDLKLRIDQLAARCNFPLKEIWVMDGSRRTAKSNAFFTGFGKNKRIALFDTLIHNHTSDELVAVLAHEIGHYKKRHVHQQIVLGIIQTGLMCFLLGATMNNRELLAAFGIQQVSVYASLTCFSILFRPISRLIGVGMSMLSRKNEYEADRFAASVVGTPQPMIAALRKLAQDNLVNLTPHPFYVFMHHSHPPMRERIVSLSRQTAS